MKRDSSFDSEPESTADSQVCVQAGTSVENLAPGSSTIIRRSIGHAARMENDQVNAFYIQQALRNEEDARSRQKENNFRGAAASLVRAIEDRFRAQILRCLSVYWMKVGPKPTSRDYSRIGQMLNSRHDAESLRDILLDEGRFEPKDKACLREELERGVFAGVDYGVLAANLEDSWYSVGSSGFFILRIGERDLRSLQRRLNFLRVHFDKESFETYYQRVPYNASQTESTLSSHYPALLNQPEDETPYQSKRPHS